MQVQLGDITVQSATDIDVFDLPLSLIMPGRDARELQPFSSWLEPQHFSAASETLHLICRSFVLRMHGRVVLVDTCVGCGKARPIRPAWDRRDDRSYLTQLEAAGVTPDQVDVVLCTHLHADHVGWNTVLADGRWVPTFPRARYLIGRTEMAYWQHRASSEGVERLNHGAHADSVLPVMAAGQVDLVDDGYELGPGVVLKLLAGHTPGQMGIFLDRGDARAVFCGDAIHSAVQLARPAWSTAFCTDAALAAATRLHLLEEAADAGRLLFPAHFRGSGYMSIARTDTGFQPRPLG